jgi:site-specific DNA-methyltransferase (adenine-specific)/modification methylase
MVWDKGYGQPAMEENILNSAYEFIFVYSRELNPNRHISTGQEFRGTLSNLYRGKPQGKHEGSEIHKATFPLHLPMHLIENFSLEGDIIFDPFLGTGTTLLAAERLNRICYGSELEPRFADLILSRWEAETGETAWCKEN